VADINIVTWLMKDSPETDSEEPSHEEESSAGAETTDSKDAVEADSVESFFTRQRLVYGSAVYPPDVDAYNDDEVRLISIYMRM